MRGGAWMLLAAGAAALACSVDFEADQEQYDRKRCAAGQGACDGGAGFDSGLGGAGSGGVSTGGAGGVGGMGGVGGTAGLGGSSGSGGSSGLGGSAGTGGSSGATGCGTAPAPGASCVGLSSNCGPNQNESCCEVACVPASTFNRGRKPSDPDDVACGSTSCDTDEVPAATATITAFWLDRFEVTVGRFRKFVSASGWQPAVGSGKHGYLNGGTEAGWTAGWSVPASASAWNTALLCDPAFQTWTSTQAGNENLPINCVSWFDAFAFCIWDGGFLPSEAEWELAASGAEERVYPWSNPPGSTTLSATHACGASCATPQAVGTHPTGNARWGHADLAGNLWEWVLDSYATYTTSPCVDCANLSASTDRVRRGGVFADGGSHLRAVSRQGVPAQGRSANRGIRCAR